MPKVLVIDDLRIIKNLPAEDTWYARNSSDALTMILKETWEQTWFDHDLGEDDDSMKVVQWIEERYHFEGWLPTLGNVFVHTANPVGAKNLTLALSKMYPVRRVNIYDMDVTSLDN